MEQVKLGGGDDDYGGGSDDDEYKFCLYSKTFSQDLYIL